MNDININQELAVPTLNNDEIDALMAKLHSDTGESDTSDGEAAQPEGAFIAEDSTSTQLN